MLKSEIFYNLLSIHRYFKKRYDYSWVVHQCVMKNKYYILHYQSNELKFPSTSESAMKFPQVIEYNLSVVLYWILFVTNNIEYYSSVTSNPDGNSRSMVLVYYTAQPKV